MKNQVREFIQQYIAEVFDTVSPNDEINLLQFDHYLKQNPTKSVMDFCEFRNDNNDPLTFGEVVLVSEYNAWLQERAS